MRKMLLLVNPVFEKRKSRDLPLLIRTFEQAGIEPRVLETGASRTAGALTERAVSEGIDLIVVCGGDGTVFDVLQGIAGLDVPLGIVPFGTGNILAQNLRIPKNPHAAARWILAARPRPVPLGKITHCSQEGKQTWFFAMSAGMGLHAALMNAVDRSQKNAGGRAAYIAAGIRLLGHQPVQPFEAEITALDGTVCHRRITEAIAVRVAELNLWRTGGGLNFPFLRLATVKEGPRWRLAQTIFDGLFGSAGARGHAQKPHSLARYEDVVRVECRPITGFPYTAPLAVQADGEVLEANCAVIEMAGMNVQLLAADISAS